MAAQEEKRRGTARYLMRGQVSVEYLVIIGLAIGILIPGVLFFYGYSQSNIGSTTASRLNEIGLRLVSATRSTYALGTNAWQTVEFTMPDAVTRAYVNDTELVFTYDTQFGQADAVFFSTVPLTTSDVDDGNISIVHPGQTRYRLTSQGSTVNITEVS